MRAFTLLTVLLLACSDALLAQGAQDTLPSASIADTQPPYRDPATARVLGTLLPGAGHIYAGEYAKGVEYYYGTVSCIGGGALAFAVSGMSPDEGPAWPLQVGGVLLVGLGIGIWVRSSLDAPRAAARATAKHNETAIHFSLTRRAGGDASPGINLGLSVAW